jgi:hypothetical protein
MGDTTNLSSDSATGYLWNTNATTQSIDVMTAGYYNVVTTDSNSCTSASDSVYITVNPLPVVDIGADTSICEDQTSTLDAGFGSFYFWSTGDTVQVIDYEGSMGSDTVFVFLQDANGCLGLDEMEITVWPLPVVYLGEDTTICKESSITLDAGTGTSYNWSTGDTTRTINYDGNNGSALISVTVTDTNGCEGQDEIDVTVNVCIGVSEHSNSNSFTIYPNPNNGNFVLDFDKIQINEFMLNIMDINGRLVYNEFISLGKTNSVALQLNELDNGFYMVHVVGNDIHITQKLIIK